MRTVAPAPQLPRRVPGAGERSWRSWLSHHDHPSEAVGAMSKRGIDPTKHGRECPSCRRMTHNDRTCEHCYAPLAGQAVCRLGPAEPFEVVAQDLAVPGSDCSGVIAVDNRGIVTLRTVRRRG